jgi:aspartyl protease family protein
MDVTGGHLWTSVKLRFLLSPGFVFLTTAAAGAAEVAVVGVFSPSKAVLVIDGDGPFTVPVGASKGPVRVRSVDDGGAVLEIDGRRVSLPIGAAPIRRDPSTASRVVLTPDARGHYLAQGAVNGAPIRFLVDTGATAVTLPLAFARSIGIDPSRGEAVPVQTANGVVVGRRVRLDRVSIGEMTLHQVDAILQEGLGDNALLGMSFLTRTDLRRDGDRLVLTKRM